MFVVVTGGSGSGKSEYAEQLVCQYSEKEERIYIATMEPFGEETKKKIERHRLMRKEKGFETIECYRSLETGIPGESIREKTVLLECMSNYVANMYYDQILKGEQPDVTALAERITEGIDFLYRESRHLVVVTNEVCAECGTDTEEMIVYKKLLMQVNQKLARLADEAVEVIYSLPYLLKQQGEREEKMNKKKSAEGMKLIIGGAYGGQIQYAAERFPEITFIDGEICEKEAIFSCQGIYHFSVYVERMIREEWMSDTVFLCRLQEENPSVIVIADEIGYGLVPVDAFLRQYRERYGRICTRLAKTADSVVRLVLGIPIELKDRL